MVRGPQDIVTAALRNLFLLPVGTRGKNKNQAQQQHVVRRKLLQMEGFLFMCKVQGRQE